MSGYTPLAGDDTHIDIKSNHGASGGTGLLEYLTLMIKENQKLTKYVLFGVMAVGFLLAVFSNGNGTSVFFGFVFGGIGFGGIFFLNKYSKIWEAQKREEERRAKVEAEQRAQAAFIASLTSTFSGSSRAQTVHDDTWNVTLHPNASSTIFTLQCETGPLAGETYTFAKEGVKFTITSDAKAQFRGTYSPDGNEAVYMHIDEGVKLAVFNLDPMMKWRPEYIKSAIQRPCPTLTSGNVPPCIELFITHARWLKTRCGEADAYASYNRGFSELSALEQKRDDAAKQPFEQWRAAMKGASMSSCNGCSTSGANIYICKKCMHSYCTNCKDKHKQSSEGVNVCPSCRSYDGMPANNIWMTAPPFGHQAHKAKEQIENSFSEQISSVRQRLEQQHRPVLDQALNELKAITV